MSGPVRVQVRWGRDIQCVEFWGTQRQRRKCKEVSQKRLSRAEAKFERSIEEGRTEFRRLKKALTSPLANLEEHSTYTMQLRNRKHKAPSLRRGAQEWCYQCSVVMENVTISANSLGDG